MISKHMREKQKLCFKRTFDLRNRMTKSELVMQEKLTNLGIKFISQKGFIAHGNFCIVDFYLPRPYAICIEVDGGYHLTEKQRFRDSDRDYYLSVIRGFTVMRFTNKQAEDISTESLLGQIEAVMRQRKAVKRCRE